jgi:hypothetical protein
LRWCIDFDKRCFGQHFGRFFHKLIRSPWSQEHKIGATQGCQMVCFQTKNPNLGKFWRVLQWKMLVYFMDSWSILRSFVIFYGHLVCIVRGNLVYFCNFGIFSKKNLKILAPCAQKMVHLSHRRNVQVERKYSLVNSTSRI